MLHNIGMSELPEEQVFEELLSEIRGLRQRLASVKEVICQCQDLDRLSLVGAVRSLIKSQLILNDVVSLFRSSSRNVTEPERLLEKLDLLIREL